MTNKEILEKAIKKAIDGGWKQDLHWIHGNTQDKNDTFMQWVSNLEITGNHAYYNYDEYFCVLELIFNHDFAKALWGEHPAYVVNRKVYVGINGGDELSTYQAYLQQMVIAEDPIKYLGEHLDIDAEKTDD